MPLGHNKRQIARQRAARRAQRLRRRANAAPVQPAPVTVVVTNIRRAIGNHAADLNKRINQNRFAHTATDILAAFGADAETLNTYLALAATLELKADAGTSGQ